MVAGTQIPGQRFQYLLTASSQADVLAFLGKANGGGFTDSGGGSCHNDLLAFTHVTRSPLTSGFFGLLCQRQGSALGN